MRSTSINSIEFNLLRNSTLGERIRFLRTKLMDEVDPVVYTTNAISKRTGIAAQTLTSIERGESKKPSFSVIHSLSKEFNVPMDVFTDEYYAEEEKLFSLGKFSSTEVELDEVDLEIEEGDSIIMNGAEYVIGKTSVPTRVRNISVYVVEELNDGTSKPLYTYERTLKEDALLQMLTQIIQTVELSVSSLSSTDWTKALEKSPLKEANDIVQLDVSYLPNISIRYEWE